MEKQGRDFLKDKYKSLRAKKKALNEIVNSEENSKTVLITQMRVNQMSQ